MIFGTLTFRGCRGQPLALVRNIRVKSQMPITPKHAIEEKSTQLLILLPLRTIYNRTFQCETPCILPGKPLFFITSVSFCPYGPKIYCWLTKNYHVLPSLNIMILKSNLTNKQYPTIQKIGKTHQSICMEEEDQLWKLGEASTLSRQGCNMCNNIS